MRCKCSEEFHKLHIPGGRESRRLLRQYVERVEEDHLFNSIVSYFPQVLTSNDSEDSKQNTDPNLDPVAATSRNSTSSAHQQQMVSSKAVHACPVGSTGSGSGQSDSVPHTQTGSTVSSTAPDTEFLALAASGTLDENNSSSDEFEKEALPPPVYFLGYGLQYVRQKRIFH